MNTSNQRQTVTLKSGDIVKLNERGARIIVEMNQHLPHSVFFHLAPGGSWEKPLFPVGSIGRIANCDEAGIAHAKFDNGDVYVDASMAVLL